MLQVFVFADAALPKKL